MYEVNISSNSTRKIFSHNYNDKIKYYALYHQHWTCTCQKAFFSQNINIFLQGQKGALGIRGDKGESGEKGAVGEAGDPGNTGGQGQKGDKGDPGPQGPAGPDSSKDGCACLRKSCIS